MKTAEQMRQKFNTTFKPDLKVLLNDIEGRIAWNADEMMQKKILFVYGTGEIKVPELDKLNPVYFQSFSTVDMAVRIIMGLGYRVTYEAPTYEKRLAEKRPVFRLNICWGGNAVVSDERNNQAVLSRISLQQREEFP